MTIDNTRRAKPNVGGLGGNVTTKAAGPGTAPQSGVFEPCSSFSGSDSRVVSEAFTSSQDAAVKTVEKSVKRNTTFTPGVSTKSSTCPVTHMKHGNSKKSSDSDARSTPQSPSSDRDEIPRCATPDKTSIMIEYCSAENENPATDSFLESIFDEPNDLSIEALFHIRDLVIPLALPRDHPDRSKPLTIVARYFISNEEPEDVDDISGGISDDAESKLNGAGDGIDDADTIRGEEMAEEMENGSIDDVFNKSGWYYKLYRSSAPDVMATAEVVLWHEDDLELALEDDSNDDEDLDLDNTMEE